MGGEQDLDVSNTNGSFSKIDFFLFSFDLSKKFLNVIICPLEVQAQIFNIVILII